MAITMENAKRMMDITSQAELSEQDFPFFRNHLSPFVEWLVEHAIEDLVRMGINQDFANSMIRTIEHMASMKGANDLFDYGVSAQLLTDNGLSDNA
ncbi:MAG: hypothetical protein ACO3CD_04960 [Candidatus Nanopelagicaceae bacterium]